MRWNLEVEEVLVQPHPLVASANHRGPSRLQPSLLRDGRLFVPTSCSLGPCFCERDIRLFFTASSLLSTNKLEGSDVLALHSFSVNLAFVSLLCAHFAHRTTKHHLYTTLMHAGQFISFMIFRESSCRQRESTTAFSSYSCSCSSSTHTQALPLHASRITSPCSRT
jgi:hypothetical protein